MDTVEDWAERKEQQKNERNGPLVGFINHLSHQERSGWKASQTNFTTGVRGSLHTNQFLTRLESLGVKNTNTREAIRNRTVQKTLVDVSRNRDVATETLASSVLVCSDDDSPGLNDDINDV